MIVSGCGCKGWAFRAEEIVEVFVTLDVQNRAALWAYVVFPAGLGLWILGSGSVSVYGVNQALRLDGDEVVAWKHTNLV